MQMSKVIKMGLSASSVDAAIEELKKYKNEINNKCELFVRKLAEVGIPVIRENMAGQDSYPYNTYISIGGNDDVLTAELIVEGAGLLFVEFGTGITYNNVGVGNSPHPKGQELGYTIGTYGKGKGKQASWGYYDENGQLVITQGTEAKMPVYKASIEMRRQMIEIAKEVFGGTV